MTPAESPEPTMTASAATSTLRLVPHRADQALQAQNFPPEKLLAYAGHIARRRAHNTSHHEDLTSYLVEIGLTHAIRYDPDRTSSTGSYTFSSYLYDVMEARVPDFYRRQSEGHADTRPRYKQPRTAHEPTDPDDLKQFERQTDALEKLISDDQRARFNRAADRAGLTLAEWVATTLDQAAA
jgi:DNA-directed RNA polymerase specialized sigma subunit